MDDLQLSITTFSFYHEISIMITLWVLMLKIYKNIQFKDHYLVMKIIINDFKRNNKIPRLLKMLFLHQFQ